MLHRVVLRLLVAVSCVLGGALHGQQWAVKMFQETEHDFGVVARGAKVEHRFVLQNPYKETVHIASVRSSCGCAVPDVVKRELKTWEKSEIVAVLNTQSFLGARSATITVTFDQPFYAEVQLHVTAYIRSDVVFQPGLVQFADVEMGKRAEAVVEIAYAGRPDWQIVDIRSGHPHVEVELDEVFRRGGNVRYRMKVFLNEDAPAGYFSDQLLIVTNDAFRSTIPLAIEGSVRSPVSISPTPLVLIPDSRASGCSKKILVRSSTPCRITEVKADVEGFAYEFDAQAVKTTHFVTVRWTGNCSQRIETTLRVTVEPGEDRGPLTAQVPVTVEATESSPP